MKSVVPLETKEIRLRFWSIIIIASMFLFFSSLTNFFPRLWGLIGFNSEDKAVLTLGLVLILVISVSGLVVLERRRRHSISSSSEKRLREEIDAPEISRENISRDNGSDGGHISQYYRNMLIKLQDKLLQVNQYAKSLADANESLSRVAAKDGLTGLYNHLFIKERLQQELYRAERYGHPLSVLMIDLDDFKKLNDKYGHVTGDSVLKTVARLIVEIIRHADVPARYGGEEFLIILPETDKENAVHVAERIRQRVEACLFDANPSKEKTLRLTVSLGVCTYPDYSRTGQELIAFADAALYGAKATGKNRVEVYRQ